MSGKKWAEVTRALEEKRHELTLSDSEIAERLKNNDGAPDMRIFEIDTLNFLEISNTGLEVVPEEIGKLVNMKNLALQRNKIANLPESIGSLQNMKFFDASWNVLTVVPETFRNFKELHTLNVSCNKLQSLPNLDSLENLVIMHIDHNQLTALPEGIYGLEHLNEIHASHNAITSISGEIVEIDYLKVLDVSNNQLKELPAALANCPRLKDLNLRENPLKDNRLKKMTSQCSTRAIMEYVEAHSSDQAKGKKGKKNKKGKGKKLEEAEQDVKKIHVMYSSKDDKHIIFKDEVKDIRPYIVCTSVKNLDLSDLQLYKKFINLQTKLHDTICNSRTTATIATHNRSSLKFPLVYGAKSPNEAKITPLGSTTEMTAFEYVTKLKEKKEIEEKKKKRQQQSGVYRFLDLLEDKESYACLMSDESVVSLPPITNSEATKVSPSICDIFIEVTSSVSLADCKEIMEKLIEQMFQMGLISSPYSGTASATDEKQLKGMVLEQVRVVQEDGQLRVIYPSKVDLQFENIPVAFID